MLRTAIVLGAALVGACRTPPPPTAVTASTPSAAPAPCEPAWLSLELTDVMDLDVAGDQLYWVEYDRGRIQRMPLAGGPAVELVAGAPGSNVPELVVLGDRVLWISGDGTLWSVPAAGGAPASIAEGFGTPHSLVRHGDDVLVSSAAGLFRVSSTFAARLTDDAASFAVDGDQLFIESTAAPCTGDCRAIVRMPLAGGAPETVALVGGEVSSVAVHGDRVLFGFDSVRSTAKRGGGAIRTDAADVFLVRNLQVAADRVYFTADNVVYQLGERATPVAFAQRNPITDLEVVGDALYTSVMDAGIRRQCHRADDPPLALTPLPAPSCPPGQTARREAFLDRCYDAHGATVSDRYWYQSGHVAEQRTAGGLEESFYTDGTKHHEAPLGDDLDRPAAGRSRTWYANGQLAEEGPLDGDGQHDGPWVRYAPDGALRARETWRHGVME